MNEKNLAHLKENLKYLGFGESLTGALEAGIREGKKDFTLTLDALVNQHHFSAALHFKKTESTDAYYFNKWEASLKTGEGKTQHTFHLNKGKDVTLKEGYNLLEGRAVYKELSDKEGQKYHAWLELSKKQTDLNGNYKMNQYHESHGFNLEKALSPLPVKELLDPEKKQSLLRSLQKGNLQQVIFEKNGFMEKLFIEASPKLKSINVYDHSGKQIPINDLEKRFDFTQKQAMGGDVTLLGKAREKINGKEIGENTGREITGKENNQKEEQKQSGKEGLLIKKGVSHGLLEKNRISHKKGLQL